ncbi:unnamed protein product, partial [Mesorhabditis spiculigera]
MVDPRRALIPRIFAPIIGLLILVAIAVVIGMFYLRGPNEANKKAVITLEEPYVFSTNPTQEKLKIARPYRVLTSRTPATASTVTTLPTTVTEIATTTEMTTTALEKMPTTADSIELLTSTLMG